MKIKKGSDPNLKTNALIGTEQIWPSNQHYRERFRVPDLVPSERATMASFKPKVIFVGESPHKDEVAPLDIAQRVPFSGRAGQSWWKLVGQVVAGEESTDRSLERVLRLAKQGKFFLINAIPYPVGADIVKHYPEAGPVKHLGFTKTGPDAYKKANQRGVQEAISFLRERLTPHLSEEVSVVCLGRDAYWFVEHVVKPTDCIPHPACWWRAKSHKQKAETILKRVLS